MAERLNDTRFHPTIRVFVSSTFSDLVHERNTLQDRVWPELERYCALRGFQFQAIDLRWGVPTEAALDHRTMRICFEELHRSQQVSPRPNFLILLGDRYGWQPLPEEITPEEFGALQEAAANAQDRQILHDWYRLDTNARPPVHLLRSRREPPDGRDYTKEAGGWRDAAAWSEAQSVLWSLINRAFPPSMLSARFAQPIDAGGPSPSLVRFQGSATEQEIWRGALAVADAPRHVVAFSREIADLDAAAGHVRLRDFVNVDAAGNVDRNLHQAVRTLKAHLRRMLGDNYLEAGQRATLRFTTDAAGQTGLQVSTGHLGAFGDQVRDRLLPIIQQQIDEYHRLPDAAQGASLPADVLRDLRREHEEHARFAAERAPAGVFVGRAAELVKIRAYLAGAGGRPFIVHGVSGSGKSALMAVAAREASRTPGAIVVERFLGTTRRSSDLRSLLIDLCHSLREHFALAGELPTDVRLLEKELYQQLEHATAERPICVFLDALDQLDPADDAHCLWWIRSAPLPAHARLVVSCLSDAGDEGAIDTWAALKQRDLPGPANAVAIDRLEPDEARLLWSRWLDRAGRTLSAAQQAAVDERIVQGGAACRQPLYLKILFEEARRWPSYAPPPPLGSSVPELLRSLFERLGQPEAHGPLLEPALGYVVSARYGLAENELLEILPRDPQYRPHLLASALHALPHQARRMPIAIWSRLRYDLAPYLTERGAPGGSVLNFYHRQVAAYVKARFAGTPARRYDLHRRLALYFARQHWWLEPRSRQRERMRPPYSARPAHVRKITELPEHLLALAREAKTAGFEGEARQALTWIERLFRTLPFLEARNEAGRVFELATDFARVLDTLPAARPQRRIVKLLDEALRRHIYFIARHAQDYPQGLFQCLWNVAWWFDCDEAAAHYEDGMAPGLSPASKRGHQPAEQLPLWDTGSSSRMNEGENAAVEVAGESRLCSLLEHWRARKERCTPGFAWVRSHRPPADHLGTALLAVLRGHGGAVNSVTYSPDGQRIASAGGSRSGSDPTVRVWDARSGAELAVLRGHGEWVKSVAYSPDGRRIASGSGDKTIRIWDASSGAELAILRGDDSINCVTFSPDGRRIAGGSWDRTVRVWDSATGSELRVLRGPLAVRSVAYSPDGRRIAGAADDTVRVWDAQIGTELAVLRGHEKGVESVSYSPNGERIVSGSWDGTVRMWDANNFAVLGALRVDNKAGVRSVAYSPDGRRIAAGLEDNTVRVWDAVSGAELAVLGRRQSSPDPDAGVSSVAYSPDGRRIVSGSWGNTVRVWDAEGGAGLAVLRGAVGLFLRESCVSPSLDGRRIVTGSFDGTVRVWDAESWAELAVLRGHTCAISSVAFSPDGRRVASGGGSSARRRDFTVRVWDVERGIELAVLHGHGADVDCVSYAPDGRRIVSSDGETVRVWDAESGDELAVLRGPEKRLDKRLHLLCCSPDGRRIVGGCVDGTVRVWDAESGAAVAVLRGNKLAVRSVAPSPDGRRIASGGYHPDNAVHVWDVDGGTEVAVLRGHEHGVAEVLFSPDGRRIVSADDRTVRVWDAGSGECLEVLQGRGDLRALAAGAAGFPWRAFYRGGETVIERAETGAPLARFPGSMGSLLCTHASGRSWAGLFASIALEN